MPDGLYALTVGYVDQCGGCSGGEIGSRCPAVAVVMTSPRVGDGCEVVTVVQIGLGWATAIGSIH